MNRLHSVFLYATFMTSVQLVYTSCTLRTIKDKHEYMLMISQNYFYNELFQIKTERSICPSPHRPPSLPETASRVCDRSKGYERKRRILANKFFTLCEITFHNNIRSEVNRLLIIICNDYIYDVPNS